MLMFKTTFKSIFDVIEESEPVQTTYAWRDIEFNSVTQQGEIKAQRVFFSKKPDSSLEEGTYYITPFMIIRTVSNKTQGVQLKNTRIIKVNDAMKHLYGIRITGFKGQDELFASNTEDQKVFFDALKRYCTCYHLMNEFNLIKIIGRGNFSKVHLGSKLGTSGKYAIKSIEKNKILENIRNMRSLTKEIEILRKVDHPGVIKLFEIYEDETHVHLILEYLKGGEVFQHIKNKGLYEENDAIKLMKELLSAIEYIHKMSIIHRDLKPENLILSDTSDDSHVIIADFGLATIAFATELEHLKCGSPGYVAPEVLNGPGYSTKADIFSVGIILYTILTGVSPFYGKTQQEVLQKNKACSIEYPDKYWSNVSLSAKSLVEKMTEKNPYKRPTATECLQHQWFNVPSIPHFGSLLAVQENIKLMQPINYKDKADSSMLTCTPVMSGRNSEDKPSPFMAPRPFIFPSDVKAPEESSGSRTPTTSIYSNNPTPPLKTPFDEYFKKLSIKPEIPAQPQPKEEDFKNDMDEMSNFEGMKFPLKTFKVVSTKGLPVTPGSEKKATTGFGYLKQNTAAQHHVINDDDINPSSISGPGNQPPFGKPSTTINPFMNPFFSNKDPKEEENKDKDLFKFFLKEPK